MKKLWNNFFVSFINGIVVLTPVVITIAIIRFLVLQVNNAVLNPIVRVFNTAVHQPEHVYIIKVLIFVFVLFVIAIIGWGAKILVINRFFSFGERVLLNVPILGRIYNAIKQISSAFIGEGKTVFKQVVLIEYPRRGLYSIGFTTGVSRGEIKDVAGEQMINVFVPTTPNPTSGVFLAVPRGSIKFLKMSIEEGMKLVISGGSVVP